MDEDKHVRTATSWLAIVGGFVAAGFGFGVYVYNAYIIRAYFAPWQEVLKEHFAAIVGLPGAALVAFVIVVFLRQTDGPIEFEGLGFKFKGASGQVAMWIASFLAMALGIWLVW